MSIRHAYTTESSSIIRDGKEFFGRSIRKKGQNEMKKFGAVTALCLAFLMPITTSADVTSQLAAAEEIIGLDN